MPNYVAKALQQFQHTRRQQQHTPYPCAPIQYGPTTQYATKESTAPAVDANAKKFIQEVCRKFLSLVRAVDSTLLCPISRIASQSATPTEDTLKQTYLLLDYLATQEEAVLMFNSSKMILAVHSDARYLSKPKACSRAGGHFFLSSYCTIPQNNGAVLNIAHIIKHVMSSATKAKLAALYIMAREAVYIRIILKEMGHKQPPTPATNRQLYGRSSNQWKNTTKTNQSNGHEISLATGQRMSTTILNILVTRQAQLCRLLDETSSSGTPPKYAKRVYNPTNNTQNDETRTENKPGHEYMNINVNTTFMFICSKSILDNIPHKH
jgi:hypothetical protein